MSGNHHREATGQKKRKTGITTVISENGQERTPIEKIFLEVVGREMDPDERGILLKPQSRHAQP
jgi:hypothetical protein